MLLDIVFIQLNFIGIEIVIFGQVCFIECQLNVLGGYELVIVV